MFEAHSILGFHHADSLEQGEIITALTCIRWTSSYHLGAGRGHTPTNTGKEGGGPGKMTIQETEKNNKN